MGGKGGGDEKAYQASYGSGLNPTQLAGMAPNTPQGDWTGMINNLNKGTLATGQKIPQYQAGTAFRYRTPGTAYKFQSTGYNPQSYSPYQYSKPGYTPQSYGQYQYNTPNISQMPQQAYQGVLDRGVEGIQQDQQRFGAQARSGMVSRGLGNSGFERGEQTGLGRASMQNAANLRSQYGLEQARSQLDVDKLTAQMDLQRQGMQAGEGQFGATFGEGQNQFATALRQWLQGQQAGENQFGAQFGEGQQQFGAGQNQWLQGQQAGENLSRSQMDLTRQGMQASENNTRAQQSLSAQLGLSGLQNQQFGAYGTLLNAANQEAMAPWQQLLSLYSPALGQSVASGGKGDPFSALLSAGATGAGAAFGGPAGAKGGSAAADAISSMANF